MTAASLRADWTAAVAGTLAVHRGRASGSVTRVPLVASVGIGGLGTSVGGDLWGWGEGRKAPFALTGPCVEGGEEAARLPISAGNAGIDHAVVEQRRGGDGVTILPAGEASSPDLLAGL